MHVLAASTATLAAAAAVLAGPAAGHSRFALTKRQSGTTSSQSVADGVAEAITQFHGADLIPKPIQSDWVNPQGVLAVSYNGKPAALGSTQQIADVKATPQFAVNYTSSQSNVFNSSAQYTLMFVDGSYNGDSSQGSNVTRHYLQNNMKLGKNNVFTGDDADAITAYGPPAPPAGDGPHRYMQLVWAQPSDFKAPAYPSKKGTWAGQSWDLATYVKEAKLGPIVAMNYVQIQNGTSTKASSTSSAAPSAVSSASASVYAKIDPSAASAAATTSAHSTQTGSKSPASIAKPAAGAAAAVALAVAALA